MLPWLFVAGALTLVCHCLLFFTSAKGIPQVATSFSLTSAPVVRKKVSDPINLGAFNADYEGWLIVIDLSTTLEVNDLISQATDDNLSLRDRNTALEQWIALMLAGWNFVDENGNPLPQPRDGGVKYCPQDLLPAISQAIGQAITPKKS